MVHKDPRLKIEHSELSNWDELRISGCNNKILRTAYLMMSVKHSMKGYSIWLSKIWTCGTPIVDSKKLVDDFKVKTKF